MIRFPREPWRAIHVWSLHEAGWRVAVCLASGVADLNFHAPAPFERANDALAFARGLSAATGLPVLNAALEEELRQFAERGNATGAAA